MLRAVFPDQPPVQYDDTVAEEDLVNIQSVHDNSFLDACGTAQSQGNIRDVSTANVRNRDSYSGAWYFTKYDSAGFEAIVRQEEDIPPHTVRIGRIQCVVPSSGIWGSEYVGVVSGVLMGAIGGVSFAVGAGLTVATGGVATPLAVGLVALVGVESAAISAAITIGIQKAAWKVGQLLPDQTYITVNGNKVWPANSDATDMNAGDCLDVKWMGRRSESTVIEIWERDVILSNDLLFRYQVSSDAEFVNNPIVAINDDKGSSYLIYLTATKDRSTRQLLIDARKEALQRQMT
jgi:hypothetical protein